MPTGTGRAVARQADHADVVAEVLAAELGADPDFAGQLENLFLELDIAEGPRVLVARGRQVVEVAAARELDRLEGGLGGGPADHDRQVVRRAGRGAERA